MLAAAFVLVRTMSRARARHNIIICLWVLHLICFGIYWSRKVVRTVSARRTQTEPKYLDHRDNSPPCLRGDELWFNTLAGIGR